MGQELYRSQFCTFEDNKCASKIDIYISFINTSPITTADNNFERNMKVGKLTPKLYKSDILC